MKTERPPPPVVRKITKEKLVESRSMASMRTGDIVTVTVAKTVNDGGEIIVDWNHTHASTMARFEEYGNIDSAI